MSNTIQLYHFEKCPYCEKARRAFQVLGIEYESHLIDPDDRSEVIEISGERSVPMIVDGETVMNESTDIVEYLDKKFGSGVHLIPGDRSQRGHAYLINKFAEKVWGSLTSYAVREVDRDGDKLDEAGKASLQDKINAEAANLNDYFYNRKYAAGDSISIGDLSLSAFLSRLNEKSNFEIDKKYAHLWEWYERVEAHLTEPV